MSAQADAARGLVWALSCLTQSRKGCKGRRETGDGGRGCRFPVSGYGFHLVFPLPGARCVAAFWWMLCVAALGMGCGRPSPSAFRSVNTLIAGHWICDEPDIPLPDRHTLDLYPDGTFLATGGLPGAYVRSLTGRYWQDEDVFGVRGTGEQGGIHVQFVRIDLTEGEMMRLRVTEILDDYVAEMMGVTSVESLLSSKIQDTLRKLRKGQIPASALGFVEVYEKRE